MKIIRNNYERYFAPSGNEHFNRLNINFRSPENFKFDFERKKIVFMFFAATSNGGHYKIILKFETKIVYNPADE